MKANELRIGNYVKAPNMNVFFRVDEILIDENIGYIATMYPKLFVDEYNGFSWMLRANICDITPIPLTEDILLKCGFEYCNFYGAYTHDELYVEIAINKENGVYALHHINDDEFGKPVYDFKMYCTSEAEYLVSGNPVEYLHQLQNLYFALAGKELDVKLS